MADVDRTTNDAGADAVGRTGGEATNPHRDPITGESGSHPVGTGVGAMGAGAVGAMIGSVAGPIGALAGAAIGSVIGGLAGKGVAEAIDPSDEEAYWRDAHRDRSYVEANYTYDTDYAPAYRLGAESRLRHHDRVSEHSDADAAYTSVENDLPADWDRIKGKSRLSWDKAKLAARDAFGRAHNRLASATAGSPHGGRSGGTLSTESASTGGAVPGSVYDTSRGASSDTGRVSEALSNSGVPSVESAGAAPQGAGNYDVSGTPSRSHADTGAIGGAMTAGSSSPSTSGAFDDSYYRQNFNTRPYYAESSKYEDYQPAYRLSHDYYQQYQGRNFDEVEADLGRDWESKRGGSGLPWDHVKLAARDAWERAKGNG